MQHTLVEVPNELSFEELDREVVDVLPAREEMLFNNLAGTGVGAQQAGLVNVAALNIGIGAVSVA